MRIRFWCGLDSRIYVKTQRFGGRSLFRTESKKLGKHYSFGPLNLWTRGSEFENCCLIEFSWVDISLYVFPEDGERTCPRNTIFLIILNTVFGKVNVTLKCTLVQALRFCTGRTAHTGSRGIALLFLDHGIRREWGVSVTYRALFTPGKEPVPIVQEAGWAPGPIWTGAERLTPPGLDPRNVQPVVSRYTDYASRPTFGKIKQLNYFYSDIILQSSHFIYKIDKIFVKRVIIIFFCCVTPCSLWDRYHYVLDERLLF